MTVFFLTLVFIFIVLFLSFFINDRYISFLAIYFVIFVLCYRWLFSFVSLLQDNSFIFICFSLLLNSCWLLFYFLRLYDIYFSFLGWWLYLYFWSHVGNLVISTLFYLPRAVVMEDSIFKIMIRIYYFCYFNCFLLVAVISFLPFMLLNIFLFLDVVFYFFVYKEIFYLFLFNILVYVGFYYLFFIIYCSFYGYTLREKALVIHPILIEFFTRENVSKEEFMVFGENQNKFYDLYLMHVQNIERLKIVSYWFYYIDDLFYLYFRLLNLTLFVCFLWFIVNGSVGAYILFMSIPFSYYILMLSCSTRLIPFFSFLKLQHVAGTYRFFVSIFILWFICFCGYIWFFYSSFYSLFLVFLFYCIIFYFLNDVFFEAFWSFAFWIYNYCCSWEYFQRPFLNRIIFYTDSILAQRISIIYFETFFIVIPFYCTFFAVSLELLFYGQLHYALGLIILSFCSFLFFLCLLCFSHEYCHIQFSRYSIIDDNCVYSMQQLIFACLKPEDFIDKCTVIEEVWRCYLEARYFHRNFNLIGLIILAFQHYLVYFYKLAILLVGLYIFSFFLFWLNLPFFFCSFLLVIFAYFFDIIFWLNHSRITTFYNYNFVMVMQNYEKEEAWLAEQYFRAPEVFAPIIASRIGDVRALWRGRWLRDSSI